MKIMTGIDLHSNNALCGLMDESGRRLVHKKLPCELPAILERLEPYKDRIATVANRYLAWAFVEAAHFACRYDERCRRFYDRKAKQTNPIIATKALACKLAKAAWHVMQADVPFDADRVFGPGGKNDFGESGREPAKGSGRTSPQD